MKQISIIIICLVIGLTSLSCTKDEIVDPPIDNPGKQKDIEWPSLAKSAWPMANHDPQSTGRSPYFGLPEGKYQWNKLGQRSWGSVVVDVDGTIYFESDDSTNGTMRALYAVSSDRSIKWKTKISDGSSAGYIKNHTTILVTEFDAIVLISRDGNVYAIDKTGNQLWKFVADMPVYSKGLTIGLDGTLYFVSGSNTLFALSFNGTVQWTKYIGEGFWGSESGPPILFSPDGTTMYVGGKKKGMYSLNLDGTVRWFNPRIDNSFYTRRMIDSEGNIYGSISDTIISLDKNGSVRWINTETRGATNFTIDYNGNISTIAVYPTTSTDVRLVSMNHEGKVRWTYQIGGMFVGDLVCDTEGTVYFGSSGTGTLYYAIRQNGVPKWIIDHGFNADFSSSPAIAKDGSIYVGSGGGGSGGDNGLFKFK